MQLNINVAGLDRVKTQLQSLSQGQLRAAAAQALNDNAFQLRRDMQQEMRTKFDRPTTFITTAPKVFPATPEKLEAYVAPTRRTDVPTAGGKMGVDPQHVLQAQEFGGRRADKRSEVLLRRAQILPIGYQTVLPSRPFPGSDDGNGNIKGAFLSQVISYLQAYSEQGFRGNMKAKTMQGLHERGGASAKIMGPFLGRRYFVSYGKLRGSARLTKRGSEDARANNLPAGIWAVLGRTGVDVRPVLLFTRSGNYKPRISMAALARANDRGDYLARRLRLRIRQQAGE